MPVKQKIKSSIFNKTRIVLRILTNNWRLQPKSVVGYFTGAGLEITGTLMTIYATAQLGSLLARYITGQPTGKIWYWLIIDILSAILIGFGFWMMSYFNKLLYFEVAQYSINNYMRQLCELDYPDFYNEEIRNQMNKVDSGFSWILPELSYATLDLFYGIIRLIAITIVVSQISWWLFPLIVIFLIPSLISEARLAKIGWWVWDEKGDERHIYWGLAHIFKQARSQMEIRSLQAKKYLTGKISRMNQIFYNEQRKKYRRANKPLLLSKVFEAGGVAVGAIVLIKQFLNGTIGFDRYLFLSGALLRVNGALNAVFGRLSQMQEQLVYAETYFNFIDLPVKMVDPPGAKKLDDKVPEIAIKDLGFKYPDTSRPIFQNLNLTIKPGEHVAIVGENGAGKSTLIKLLMRFYYPTQGEIEIDSTNLNQVAINSWYKHLATLFQDFNRYPFSIRENIQMTDDPTKKDENELLRATRLADVDSIAKSLPYGLDTVLDSSFKEGVEPSGGQYQRVALARAFYRKASVLILDEPTAAIDAKAEYEIFNNIFNEYKNRTTIIVSHRFSTVRRADRIIVLDQGKIIEEGSHEQLMKKNGLYKDMFSKQAEGYK